MHLTAPVLGEGLDEGESIHRTPQPPPPTRLPKFVHPHHLLRETQPHGRMKLKLSTSRQAWGQETSRRAGKGANPGSTPHQLCGPVLGNLSWGGRAIW